MKIVLCQQKTLFEKPHIKFTKEWITCHTTSHFFLIYLKKKNGILIVAKSKHPSPYSSREFDRKKLTYSHFAHTLSAPLNTEQWVDKKYYTVYVCISW